MNQNINHIDASDVSDYLKSIESEDLSYDNLLQYDYLFEIKGRKPDDNNLIDVVGELNSDNYDYRFKLRGARSDLKPRLADRTNNHAFCHGYVISVNRDQVNAFEKEILLSVLKNTITVRKFTIGLTHDDIKQHREDHFNSLFAVT